MSQYKDHHTFERSKTMPNLPSQPIQINADNVMKTFPGAPNSIKNETNAETEHINTEKSKDSNEINTIQTSLLNFVSRQLHMALHTPLMKKDGLANVSCGYL